MGNPAHIGSNEKDAKMRHLLIFLALTTAVEAHEPYTKWSTHDGLSCCNANDCAIATIRFENGTMQALVKGKWHSIPSEAIRPYDSPDGQSHVCFFGGKVQCFVPGTGT